MILVDTHIPVWLALEPGKLSVRASNVIRAAREKGEGLGLCDISLLEISTLDRKGRVQFDFGLESFLREVEDRFTIFPITGRACLVARTFPADYPQDPADRIIGATAVVEGLPLVTADREIRKSKAIQTIW
jgi:PIN domain nuclease of toxin-antitoxin system